jgi:predicted GIY-YIG superfamily endonuclease
MMIPLPAYAHCVYVAHDRELTPIYVGVSSRLFARLHDHTGKDWWSQVTSISVESFPTREEADARELELIRIHQTSNNKASNPRVSLEGGGITASDVRDFIEARKKSQRRGVLGEGLTTLRAFAEDSGVGIHFLRSRRDRDESFPQPVAERSGSAMTYKTEDLKAWLTA